VKLTEELENGINTYLNAYATTFKAHIGQSIITRRRYARIAAIEASPKVGSMVQEWSKRTASGLPCDENGKFVREYINTPLRQLVNKVIALENKDNKTIVVKSSETKVELPKLKPNETKPEFQSISARLISYFQSNDSLPLTRTQLSHLMNCTDQAFDYPLALLQTEHGIEIKYNGNGWTVTKRKPLKSEKHLAMERALGKEIPIDAYNALSDLLKDLV